MNDLLLFITVHFTLSVIFILCFGALVGSFLNVVIYRYPIMLKNAWAEECHARTQKETFNLCMPRSHCFHCKKNIHWWMNIPIISFILLRARCFFCKKSISSQYMFVEIISAIGTLIVFLHFSISLIGLEVLLLTYGLIVLSFIDFNHRILPDTITFMLLWLGMIVATQHIFIDPTEAIFGVITGYLFLWCIAQLYCLLRKKEGMGLGDCKLLAMFGAWVGVAPLFSIILSAAVLALCISVVLLTRKKISTQSLIPFGPFIALMGWSVVIYQDFIARWVAVWIH